MCKNVLFPPNALCPGFAHEYWCGRFGVSVRALVHQEELQRARGVAHCSVARRTGGERIVAAVQEAETQSQTVFEQSINL